MSPHSFFHGFRIPAEWERRPLPIVTREEWGAEPPKEVSTTKTRIKSVVFAFNTKMGTCVDREQCRQSMQELQKRHMALGYTDIYYNFVIGGDGNVYEGRGWSVRHPATYHPTCGRCLVVGIIGQGKDDQKVWLPPFDWTTKTLVKYGRAKKYIIKDPKFYEDRFEIEESDKSGKRYFPYDPDEWVYKIPLNL